MNAHTEHNATLAQVIADDASCTCSGACVNGRQACTCGLGMPVPTGWAASSATELGADDDYYRLPRRADDITWDELLAAIALVAVLILAVLCWPEGFSGYPLIR